MSLSCTHEDVGIEEEVLHVVAPMCSTKEGIVGHRFATTLTKTLTGAEYAMGYGFLHCMWVWLVLWGWRHEL